MDEEVRYNTERVADKLYEDIRDFFQEKLPAEQTIRTEVQPLERILQHEDDQQVQYSLTLTFCTPTDLALDGHFLITHSGGNVFAISASIGDGEPETFEISLPDASGTQSGTDVYTHNLCRFILAEIERITGEHFLRGATESSDE